MAWFRQLFYDVPPSMATAHAVLTLGLAAVLGLALGRVRFFGLRLGVAGVLFVGLLFGHFGIAMDHPVLEFARDFGLILFVYTIGIQIGPGFGASLRKQGLPLNLMAATIVALGVVLTIVIGRFALPKAEFPAFVGVFCGATTSTPSLAAAQQAIGAVSPADAKLPALGYAVAYPLGVIGIIVSMFLMRVCFGVKVSDERDALAEADGYSNRPLEAVSIEVTNDDIEGATLEELVTQTHGSVVVSRVMQGVNQRVAIDDDVISTGDVLLAVGRHEEIESFTRLIGHESNVDLKRVPSGITTRHLLVTQRGVIGKAAPDLDMLDEFGVRATRIIRGDVEMPANAAVPIMFGDRLTVVGGQAGLKQAASYLGDSVEARDHPMLIPMFLGISLGIVLGSIPIPIPGFPVPVTLGLAGGPLIAAIVLGRLGKVGPLVWYMPRGANLSLRKIGIILFLACVGMKAGDKFVDTLVHGHGLLWMGYGVVITMVPLLLIGAFARLVRKLNYVPLCGLLAGSMTDTAALAFATTATNSQAPSVAYASVYPMVMLLRILAAQLMILYFH